jgi:hypothetical protein
LGIVYEYWDGGFLKVFRGEVTIPPDDKMRVTAE